jgi:hypothetical protein
MSDETVKTDQPIDPMEMSLEDFQKALSDEPVDIGEASAEQVSVEEGTEEPLPPETGTEEETPGPDEELFEIVYKGEVKKLPKTKIKELAQKGFSYHEDMNRIAKQKKIVKLIEEDEEIGKLVNDYVVNRAKPKLAKLDEYDSEEAWLSENLKRLQKAEKFAKVQQPNPGQDIIEFFRDKDPENYERVLLAISQQADNLTVAEYKKANSSLEGLEELYDKTKRSMATNTTGQEGAPRQTFRVRSGGGDPPRTTQTTSKVWELSSKDFEKMLQEARGY